MPVAKGVEGQPIDRVRWVPADQLRANDYNPNKQAPPAFRLLKVSIMEDGWTQPIVARSNGEIVDGFHRWTLHTTDSEVAALTDGLVPVVFLSDEVPEDQQRMSTIRHNRARGSHYVAAMSDIVRDLVDELGMEAVSTRLQMDMEEVQRLYDRGAMTARRAAPGYTKAWMPTEKNGPDDDYHKEDQSDE